MEEVVSIKNLGKSYSDRVIFSNINISVKVNEPIVIIGENGCGKSTLLKIIAGLLNYTEGEISYKPKIKISYMPDRFPKLPFSVESYLIHMGKIQGVSNKEVSDFINENFAYLNMPQHYRKQKIYNCSKGTIQKINILQALITKPELLILDEPFAGLDDDSVESFIEMLKKLVSEGTALIMTCHEKTLGQRISESLYIFKEQKCCISNEFSKHFCIKFFHNNPEISLNAIIEGIVYVNQVNELCEALVEKDKLKEVLGLLFEYGFEIHSINPR